MMCANEVDEGIAVDMAIEAGQRFSCCTLSSHLRAQL